MLASFCCNDCEYKNTEVIFAGKLAEFGVKMVCTIVSPVHLNRLIVKSEYASIKIPELNVDIPARTQRGMMNSVEGILSKMAEGLSEGQEDRKESDPETYQKLEQFIATTQQYARGEKLPFTVILDDPSGNSHIQNPYAPTTDPYNVIEYYIRSKSQLIVPPFFTFFHRKWAMPQKKNQRLLLKRSFPHPLQVPLQVPCRVQARLRMRVPV